MDNLVKENSRLGGTKGSPCLQAVVEAPFYEDAPLFPWAIAIIQRALKRYQIKLMTYDPKQEEIRQWIN